MRVFQNAENENEFYVMGDPKQFKVCQLFRNGEQIGCGVGCYSLDNEQAREEVIRDLYHSIYGVPMKKDLDYHDYEDALEDMKEYSDYDDKLDSVENHLMVEGYSFWNGRNHDCLIVDDDEYHGDLIPIDEDLEKDILEKFEKVDTYIEGVDKEVVVGRYTFYLSRMQDMVAGAIVTIDDDVSESFDKMFEKE